ncbi:hypothetical protein [Flavobacterium pectinovorum]|uniref:Uncharacterized protein n=1 Tax=Flavobacterium pectinovorum TaxID=29533 RepID=A0A502F026_9FLAO|nr:hypothetical protein [Flavobacterium pectinovorum]TPG41966.1 hypothetical protein EAH81_06490 [Flavobacterium pectinovorum]
MAIQTLETIKNWFRTGRKPKQTQFWDTWDSFRHKSEEIPVAEINGIDELLQNKTDSEIFENHLTDPNAHAECFVEKLDKGGFTGTAKNIDDRLSAIENPDRVLKFGTITLTGLNITIPANAFVWVLNKISYLSSDAYSETISAATTGMYRNDIVVGNNLGTYQIIQGLEGTTGTAAAEPSVPIGTIKLGFISVFGAIITDSGSAPSIEKVTIVDNDRLFIEDSESSFSKKAIKFLNIKTTLTPFFEALFLTQTTNQNISGIKTFLSGKFGLRNVANTFTSFFTNANTASRTYTLQNRDGTLLDNTDLSTINTALGTKQAVFSGVANYITKSINSTTLGVSRLLDNGTSFGIGTAKSPTKDITLGNQINREIGIEESSNTAIGKDLTISAGRTINYTENAFFNALTPPFGFSSYGMCSTPSGNIYIVTLSNKLYKQTYGSGPFVDLGTVLPQGTGALCICSTSTNDLYIGVLNGDIYKQTNETGPFVALGQTSRQWYGLCALGTSIYASVQNGDIYKQTGGTGNFIALGQTNRIWTRMAASSTSVYVCVSGGGIYKQTNGNGAFTQHSANNSTGITISKSNDIFINIGTDIFKQTNETGPFVATGSTVTSNGIWGMATHSNGNIYAGDFGSTIFMMQNNGSGAPNLDGGTFKHKAGTGKGTGRSRHEFYTGQKTAFGTDMQVDTLRCYIDENGYMIWVNMPTYSDNTAAISGGLPTGCEYKTVTGDRKIVY